MTNNKIITVGINGFGRIGRLAARIILTRPHLKLAAVNSRAEAQSHAYLLKYDSTYGILEREIKAKDNELLIAGEKVFVFKNDSPSDIPWSEAGVSTVLEASGKFRTGQDCQGHLRGTVRQVIISAPAKDDTKTIVLGVNQKSYHPGKDAVISNSSCTTNCLATTFKPLIDTIGIRKAFMTTVHAATDSQNLLDNSHSKEVRLRRSVFPSIIPASTGSAKDIVKLFPQLQAKIVCQALRIPTQTVSLIQLTAETDKRTSPEEITGIYKEATRSTLKGILGTTEEKLVSVDFKGNPYSSTVDLPLISVVDGNLINVSSWYDNEWGYASRLVDLLEYTAR